MIELRDLTAGYDGTAVFRDISLSFPEGMVTVLAGPNGCGKSTLLKTVLGIQKRLSGQVLFDGVPSERLSAREIAQRVSYLSQSRTVPCIAARSMVLHGRFPYLSYPRRYRSEDYAIADRAMARTDCTELADRMMPELSGGQCQKVWLAMALAQDTATILMDEPTTYLDIRHQLEVMRISRELAREGRAVVLVLHDLALALQYADRIAVLADGELKAQGTPQELYESGIPDRVFGIRLRRVDTESGPRYYYE